MKKSKRIKRGDFVGDLCVIHDHLRINQCPECLLRQMGKAIRIVRKKLKMRKVDK